MRINQFKTYFLRLCLILVNNLFAILLFYFGTKSKIHIVHVQQEIQNQHSQDPYTTHIVHLYIHFQSFINDSLHNSSKSSDFHVFFWLVNVPGHVTHWEPIAVPVPLLSWRQGMELFWKPSPFLLVEKAKRLFCKDVNVSFNHSLIIYDP